MTEIKNIDTLVESEAEYFKKDEDRYVSGYGDESEPQFIPAEGKMDRNYESGGGDEPEPAPPMAIPESVVNLAERKSRQSIRSALVVTGDDDEPDVPSMDNQSLYNNEDHSQTFVPEIAILPPTATEVEPELPYISSDTRPQQIMT